MNFTKIHFTSTSGPKMELQWDEKLSDGHSEEYQLKADVPPLPSFTNALKALKPHFLDIMELPDEYGDRMDVIGVTMTWDVDKETDESAVKKAKLIARKTLQERSQEVVAMHTPKTQAALSENCIAALDQLNEEAKKYVDGERAQGDLFAGRGDGAEDRPPEPGNVVRIGDTEAVRKHAEVSPAIEAERIDRGGDAFETLSTPQLMAAAGDDLPQLRGYFEEDGKFWVAVALSERRWLEAHEVIFLDTVDEGELRFETTGGFIGQKALVSEGFEDDEEILSEVILGDRVRFVVPQEEGEDLPTAEEISDEIEAELEESEVAEPAEV